MRFGWESSQALSTMCSQPGEAVRPVPAEPQSSHYRRWLVTTARGLGARDSDTQCAHRSFAVKWLRVVDEGLV